MSPNMMTNNNNRNHNVSRRGFHSGPRRVHTANHSATAQPIVTATPVAATKSAKQQRSEETLAEVSRALSETNTVRRRVLQGTESNPTTTYTIEFVTLQQLQARTVTDNVQRELKPARIMDISKDVPTHPIHAQNEQMTEVKGDVQVFLYNLESVRRVVCGCGSVSAVPCVAEVDEVVRRLMSLRAPGNHDDGDRHKTGMTSAESIAHAAADKLHRALSKVKGGAVTGRCECHSTAKVTAAAAGKKTKGVSGKKKTSHGKAVADVCAVVATGKVTVEAIGVVSVSSFVWADEMDQLEGEDVLNMDFSQPLFTLSPRH